MERSLLKVNSIIPVLMGVLNNCGYFLIVKFRKAKRGDSKKNCHVLSIKSALQIQG